MLADKRPVQSIRLRSLLSFGPQADPVELHGLNVLIGPNGSGKSNLIEAIGLLRACPGNLAHAIVAGGGAGEWLWKGGRSTPSAEIEVNVQNPMGPGPLRHRLEFTAVAQRFEVADESVDTQQAQPQTLYGYRRGHPVIAVRSENGGSMERPLRREDLAPDQSVLSQRRDPESYPELTHLGNLYGRIRIYRELETGRNSPLRLPQKADVPGSFLAEDAGNLGLVLNHLEAQGLRGKLLERLRDFHQPAEDISTRIDGGTVQVLVHEAGLREPVPATRLSDGTLRYLCLLAILCHPSPPPLICIEEPEVGLHPDVLAEVAELLVDASTRTQLIVTTHSEALVDALTDTPDAVLVCEKQGGSTSVSRLNRGALNEWLEHYSLGQLWRKGEIGGNRW